MEFISFIRSLEHYVDKNLLETISTGYNEIIDPGVYLDSIADIVSHSDRADYKLTEMELVDYFDAAAAHGYSAYNDALNHFARLMYNKYTAYTKTHINQYMDMLSDNTMRRDYPTAIRLITDRMKAWEYASDTEMLNSIKIELIDHTPDLITELGTRYPDFIRAMFVSEKLNRLYHMVKNIFIPQMKTLM